MSFDTPKENETSFQLVEESEQQHPEVLLNIRNPVVGVDQEHPAGNTNEIHGHIPEFTNATAASHIPSFYAASHTNDSFLSQPESPKAPVTKVEMQLMKGDNSIILLCCSLTVFLMYLGISIPIAFLPGKIESLGASPVQVGLLFAVFPFASSILVSPAGWMCQRFGRLPILFIGLNIMGVAMIFFGLLGDSLPGLYVMRACQGIGGSLGAVAATAIITNEFREKIGEAMGIRELFSGVAFVLGPTIGGLLYQLGGFAFPFLLIGSLKVACSFPFFWLIRRSIARNRAAREAMDNFRPSFSEGEKLTRKEIVTLTTVIATITMCLAYVNFSFVEPQLEGHFERILGLSAGAVGGMYAIAAVAYSSVAIIAGKLTQRFDAKKILLLGNLLGIVALLIVGPFPGVTISSAGLLWAVEVLFMLLLGSSGGFLITTSYVILENNIPNKVGQAEVCSAILTAGEGLTSSIVPIIGGLMVQGLPQTDRNCYHADSPDAETACYSGFPWASLVVSMFFTCVFFVVLVFLPSQPPASHGSDQHQEPPAADRTAEETAKETAPGQCL